MAIYYCGLGHSDGKMSFSRKNLFVVSNIYFAVCCHNESSIVNSNNEVITIVNAMIKIVDLTIAIIHSSSLGPNSFLSENDLKWKCYIKEQSYEQTLPKNPFQNS